MENEISNLSMSKINKFILVMLVLVVILSLVYVGMAWWVGRSSGPVPNTPNNISNVDPLEQANQQAGALLGQSNIVFPPVSKLAHVSVDSLSTDYKALILDDMQDVNVNKISYDNSQTGFFITYSWPSTTIEKLKSSNVSLFAKGKWKPLNGISSPLASVQDFENIDSHDKAQARFIQNGEDIQVIIKTLRAPK